ncbi:keratin-associated protein 5-8-like [Ruditapes philippinarum]|uniref:keratin-associated protein 5-8-like n=1 Tax=Ruditapes philippinarum TaxID=129788 RepID=UPI00295B72B7|nr:keratin-associated protein 5-8-like [Ruditapes philippinarum]
MAMNYKIAVFLSLIVVSLGMRVKRREGDQSPPGQCATYKWGGTSGVHWYACCNNCNRSDTSCDGKTYQSASDTKYCANCGIDTKKGNGKSGATYSCGGCQGQERSRKKCLSNLRMLYKIPGLCWAFAKCFQKKCKSQPTESTPAPDMCFNLRCDPGEDVNNCPADCCGNENEKCKWSQSNTCVPKCCSESTCCNDSSRSGGLYSLKIHYVSILSIMMSVVSTRFNV